ncbi:MAG: peptide-methionine (S)-S-oxide reductase MsrA [Cellvibrionales bacterium]|nr:peptide-methionine (S)-S-oxide reductase MsrA [Cellvibrionales bacterium]
MASVSTVYLGGGCFWCLQTAFKLLDGVIESVSGYMGGDMPNPDYESVCSGRTGHIEVVKVVFDTGVLPLNQVLTSFFALHDPTSMDQQGADKGTQYRSAIFYQTDEQQKAIAEFIASLEVRQVYNKPIVTQVQQAPEFYPAEDYHQDYFEKNPLQGYCQMVVAPKLEKFIHASQGLLKKAD